MKKLWKNLQTISNKLVDEYCFSVGTALDNQLVDYDVYGSIAHAQMLAKIGIINDPEFKKLKKCMLEIIDLYRSNKIAISPNDEDVHTKIENYLTEKLGDLGKKIHAGRSRNDQILVDLRLYSIENLIKLAMSVDKLAKAFALFAKQYEFVPMPGYTHMQKAMPSSVGMWAGSFAEQLTDLLDILKSVYQLNDQSPLGSGAAYGVSLPIDRELTAKILGFGKVQNNSLYCQISRVTIQLAVVQLLVQIMLCASRFAQDLLIFTTSEFNYFDVDESICTGSSIMPQKKNLDLMELIRAKAHTVIAYEQIMAAISSGLPSGYNADYGQTKEPFMKSFEITAETIEVMILTLQSIKPNINNLVNGCSQDIYATDYAYKLVKNGLPFRDAYLQIKNDVKNIKKLDPVSHLKSSNHTGGTNNLKLNMINNKLAKQNKYWENIKAKHNKVIGFLLS